MLKMRVAVVGGGVSGLMSAYALAKEGLEVVLYEKEDYLGGHANTIVIDDGTQLDLTSLMVFSRISSPEMMELFENLGVDMETSDMSFSVSLDDGHGCQWGTRNGLSSLFAQKKNILNPYFWKMIREIIKFKDDASAYVEEHAENLGNDREETLEHFVQSRDYSELFQKAFLIPACASLWPCSSALVMSFSAYSVLSLLRNHHVLQLFGQPLTPRWRLQSYVNIVKKELETKGCRVKINSQVYSVLTNDDRCIVTCKDGKEEEYDGCIIAANAPEALKILGNQATYDETRLIGAFQYAYSDVFLHHDKNLMPENPAVWSSFNFLETVNDKVYLTYWLNSIQNNDSDTRVPFLLTVNPRKAPERTLLKWSESHPIPSVAVSKASNELKLIQGKRRIWFCGAYLYGHENGVQAGLRAANGLLGKRYTMQNNPKHIVPSWSEAGARLLVIKFLEKFIATGCLILLEDGGIVLTFEGTKRKSSLKVCLMVHSPQFYWKVATASDIGLADAYADGDFSFIDKNEGLLNLLMLFATNTELNNYTSKSNKRRSRGWWTPLLSTSVIASAKYFHNHISRKNTLTQARKNISQHYDLSNELFSLFLDETMAYSCAMFKSVDEELKNAQLRKFHTLIDKARIRKDHHILEIGCGWGTLAIEAVKRTGCEYTGITLSEKQLQYAQLKVKEAGLQDRIKFLLCDYRQLPENYKFDRIISCEMLEAVGHEYMEEFFRCCESALAENGLVVFQFISVPDERYDEFRRSPGFIKEYIFPGVCCPSLSRITSAMAAASRLGVVHLEEIGSHYVHTVRRWRENLLQNQSKIINLGFNDKFIRTWELYFDTVAAAHKSGLAGNYQIVFSRPGDIAAFGNGQYNALPSANYLQNVTI